jgi:hypothetical protein
MKIEVSNGELLDKLSILEIKREKIKDDAKLDNINGEYDLIKPLANNLVISVKQLYESLLKINLALWEIEDTIRNFEQKQDFGQEFIQTARSVYVLNDERAKIKKEINRITNSGISEEKSYASY